MTTVTANLHPILEGLKPVSGPALIYALAPRPEFGPGWYQWRCQNKNRVPLDEWVYVKIGIEPVSHRLRWEKLVRSKINLATGAQWDPNQITHEETF